ncbi:hypothetical protein [Spirosoma harenae]
MRKLNRAQDLLVKARSIIKEVAKDEQDRLDDSSDFAKNEYWRNMAIQYLADGEIVNNAITYVQAARFAHIRENTLV